MTIPIVNIYEFDITQSSPAFTRHIPSGSIAYVKELGSGSTSDYLDFNLKALKTGGYHVFQTSVIVFRMSSIGNTVFNMRFWTPDQSALSAGSSYYQYGVSGVWGAFSQFTASGAIDMNAVPTSLPSTQNLFRQNDGTSLTGILDTDVSQYLYLSLCLETTYPNGRYGTGEATSFGRFLHRVTYDYT